MRLLALHQRVANQPALLAFVGSFALMLAKHKKHLRLADMLSIGADHIHHNFKPAMSSKGGSLHPAYPLKREPTCPAGRKRNADQTSLMAMMDMARHPALLIASRITSRLRSLSVLDVFFGNEIHTKAFRAACFGSFLANLLISDRRLAKICTNGYIPAAVEEMASVPGMGASSFR